MNLWSEQKWADAATKNCVWLFQVLRIEPCGEEEHTKQCWETEIVFLTKREAKEYGASRPYAHGEYLKGWRIWGVPCDGLMVEFIGQHAEEFESEVEYIGHG